MGVRPTTAFRGRHLAVLRAAAEASVRHAGITWTGGNGNEHRTNTGRNA